MTEKETRAQRTVKKYMWWSMGAGVIPIPFVDWLAVSGVQLKMISELAKIYDLPFQKDRGKAVIGSLSGFILPHATACGLIGTWFKAIPVIGFIAGGSSMAVLCGAYEWALGNVFIQHFESGGTFLDFDPEAVREYFKAQFEEGKRVVTTIDAPEKAEAAT